MNRLLFLSLIASACVTTPAKPLEPAAKPTSAEPSLAPGACLEVAAPDDGSGSVSSLELGTKAHRGYGKLQECGLAAGKTSLRYVLTATPAESETRATMWIEQVEQVEVPTGGTLVVKAPSFPTGTRTIEGSVVDGAGAPWVFEVVKLTSSGVCATVSTDRSGRFKFEGLPAADYVVAPLRGASVRTTEGVSVALRKTRPAHLTFVALGPEGAKLGRLEGTAGAAHVMAICLRDKCEVDVAPGDRLTLRLQVEGLAPRAVEYSLKDGEVRDLGTLQFTVGRKVTGTLVDASGKPAEGQVLAWTKDRTLAEPERFTQEHPGLTTNSKGEFVLEHLGDEEVMVSARSDAGVSVTVTLPSKAKSLQLKLQRGTRVTVTLSGPPGAGQAGRVRFMRIPGASRAVAIGAEARAVSPALADGDWVALYEVDPVRSLGQQSEVTTYLPRRLRLPTDREVTLTAREGGLTAQVFVKVTRRWRPKLVLMLDTPMPSALPTGLDLLEQAVLAEISLTSTAWLVRGVRPGPVTVIVSWESDDDGSVRDMLYERVLAEGATRIEVNAPE